MNTPGRGRDHSRLREVERRQAAEQRRSQQQESVKLPTVERFGIWRAICTSAITHATAGTIRLVYRNGTDYVGRLTDKTCYGFTLNTTETISVDQALWVVHLEDNTWEVLSGNCAVRDWELANETEYDAP